MYDISQIQHVDEYHCCIQHIKQLSNDYHLSYISNIISALTLYKCKFVRIFVTINMNSIEGLGSSVAHQSL